MWRLLLIFCDSDCLQGHLKSMAREALLLITFPHLHRDPAGEMRNMHKHKHTYTRAPQGLLHVWATTDIMYRRHPSRLRNYFCPGGPAALYLSLIQTFSVRLCFLSTTWWWVTFNLGSSCKENGSSLWRAWPSGGWRSRGTMIKVTKTKGHQTYMLRIV